MEMPNSGGEHITKHEWADETETMGPIVADFIKDTFTFEPGEKMKYDHLDLHISGGDNKWRQRLLEGAVASEVKVLYADGKITKIHARVEGASDDFYFTGSALDDLIGRNEAATE